MWRYQQQIPETILAIGFRKQNWKCVNVCSTFEGCRYEYRRP